MIKMTFVVAAVAATAALLTACSSSSGSSASTTSAAAGSTAAASSAGSTAAASSGSTGTAAISVATSPLGSYLVDSTGKAIYILTSDKPNGASACTTGCLQAWPPVAAPTPLPSGISGVTATFGTFKAADGTNELTINGYPAYNFIKDTGPGTTSGQGIVSFGGTWWLLSPSGSFITASAGSASPASSSAGAVVPAY
jgi:predicted lipoprotein with Yx(FWY)xxD motif